MNDTIAEKLINEYWYNKVSQFDRILPLVEKTNVRGLRKLEALTVSSEVSGAIEKLTKGDDKALMVVFLAFYKMLLMRYFPVESILVGGSAAVRDPKAELAFYKTHLTPDLKVAEVLQLVKKEVEATSKYTGMDLSPKSIAGKPLAACQFYFSYNAVPPDLNGIPHLNILVSRDHNRFTVSLEYDEALLPFYLAERFHRHYLTILNATFHLASKPGEIKLLDTVEEREIITLFNSTRATYDYQGTLHGFFERRVSDSPEAVAVISGNKKLTYRELDDEATRLAGYIREKFAPHPEDVIGVLMDKSENAVISILAILKAGCAYLPVSPAIPGERRNFMLGDAAVKVLITVSDYMFGMSGYSGHLLVLDIERPLIAESLMYTARSAPTQLAYVIFTSGSTGNPKGVLVEHAGAVNMALAQIKRFGITAADRVVQVSSLSFDASVSEIFTALLSGATLVMCDDATMSNVTALEALVLTSKVSVATFPPSYLSLLNENVVRSLRALITAGEAAQPKHAATYAGAVQYFNAYGPTECTVCTSIHNVSEADGVNNFVPIGRPLENTKSFIVDRSNQLVPVGVVGEICVSGVCVSRGYLNQPEITNEYFVQDPFDPANGMYRTGDFGRWLPDGSLQFEGRRDSQIKLNGLRIELGEIHARIMTCAWVKDSYVTTMQKAGGDVAIVAFIVSKDPAYGREHLLGHLAMVLPSYMIPAFFSFVDGFAFNNSGKVDKSKLPDPFAAPVSRQHTAPVTTVEHALQKIWIEILGTDNVSVTDNFFQIGGDSLKAIKMTSLVNERYQGVIEVADLFVCGTIREIAAMIAPKEHNAGDVSNEEIKSIEI